jgi:hypothetical protein
MMELLTFREKELPCKWDGEPVTWGDPIAVGAVFICPPPRGRDACPNCGQLRVDGADHYVGRTPQTEPAYWVRDHYGKPRKYPERTYCAARLSLTRCLGCSHDVVLDLDTDELWDLDESDYGSDGSWPKDD